MRTIGIDCRFASTLAGLGTFTRELTTALLHADSRNRFVLFVSSEEEPWLKSLLRMPNVSCRTVSARPYSLREQLDFPRIIRSSRIDLLYVPHFNVPLFCPVPFVCTVHDLILHHYPNQASLLRRLAYRLIVAVAVHRARDIVTVSNATRKDVLRQYRLRPDKVVTIYPGLSPVFTPASDELRAEAMRMYGIGTQPFFLYVGNCKEHKNVQTLIDAFASSGLEKTHHLLLASSGSECARLTLTPGARFIGPIEERLLPALYSLAVGFVTATRFEGFCLPVIEAMACGCPVAATNTGPIPEISGGHALLLAPEVRAFADAMKKLASDPLLSSRERLESARAWATRFTWTLAAAEVHGVLLTV